MKIALNEAKKAYKQNEIPVGCVIVLKPYGEIITKTHNMSEQRKNPNFHAEILAINEACKKMDNKNLSNCDIYVTLEPCIMCASAISNARIKGLYYAASDVKQGSVEHNARFYTTNFCFHRPDVYNGILSLDSEKIIQSFFRKLRKNKL